MNPANSKLVTGAGLLILVGNLFAELHGVTTGGFALTLNTIGVSLAAIGKGIFAAEEGQ